MNANELTFYPSSPAHGLDHLSLGAQVRLPTFSSDVQFPRGERPDEGWPVVLLISRQRSAGWAPALALLGSHLKRWGCAVVQLHPNADADDLAGLLHSVRSAVSRDTALDPSRFGIACVDAQGVWLHAFNGYAGNDAFMEIDVSTAPDEVPMWMTEHLW